MKYVVTVQKPPKQFESVNVTIILESEEEVKALYERLNFKNSKGHIEGCGNLKTKLLKYF